MNDDFFQQLMAELIEANGQALGTLAAAVAKQIDPERLTADLRSQLSASEKLGKWSPIATRIAMHALAAAEAETALRTRSNH